MDSILEYPTGKGIYEMQKVMSAGWIWERNHGSVLPWRYSGFRETDLGMSTEIVEVLPVYDSVMVGKNYRSHNMFICMQRMVLPCTISGIPEKPWDQIHKRNEWHFFTLTSTVFLENFQSDVNIVIHKSGMNHKKWLYVICNGAIIHLSNLGVP